MSSSPFRDLLWLLSYLVSGLMLATDPAYPSPADIEQATQPIRVDHLSVRAADGSTIPFSDLIGPDGRAVCFAFLHPSCPLSREYAPVLDHVAAGFAKAGIRFVGLICESDDLKEVEAYRREYGITFPIHLDADFRLAEALNATITPEVVLVDRDRRIDPLRGPDRRPLQDPRRDVAR
jgi:thiol-disulfide isomerase/thioredoxin